MLETPVEAAQRAVDAAYVLHDALYTATGDEREETMRVAHAEALQLVAAAEEANEADAAGDHYFPEMNKFLGMAAPTAAAA